MAKSSKDLEACRNRWQWRGQARPAFAEIPASGQESVWDYPRPPRLAPDSREVVIRWDSIEIARTRSSVRVLETTHPPSFYIPWHDVAAEFLESASGGSFCEWKGPARYWSLVRNGARRGGARDEDACLINVAWSYPDPLRGAERLADCVAFYPAALQCTVDGDHVTAQPGGFYGGWITADVVGPFKGGPGSSDW